MVERSCIKKVVDAIRQFYSKTQFFEMLNQELKVGVPPNYSFGKALELTINSGLGASFFDKVFGVPTMERACEVLDAADAIGVLTKPELVELATHLSGLVTGTTKSISKQDLGRHIATSYGLSQLSQAVAEAFMRGKIEETRYTGESSLGPLGVLKHEHKWDLSAMNAVSTLLRETLESRHFAPFIQEAGLTQSGFEIAKCRCCAPEVVVQLVISRGTEQRVLMAMNRMISDGRLQIDAVHEIDGYYMRTPFGIFEKLYSPDLEKLAEMTIRFSDRSTLEAALKKQGIGRGSLGQRLVEHILLTSPDQLRRLVGPKDIKSMADELGLVAFQTLPPEGVEGLWQCVLVKLGFNVPPIIVGLLTYQNQLRAKKAELKGLLGRTRTETESQKNGIVVSGFSGLERILRAVVYFYVSLLWREEVEAAESKLEESMRILCEEVSLPERLHHKVKKSKLSCGDMITVLRAMGKPSVRRETAELQRETLSRYFDRESMVPQEILELLDKVVTERNKYDVHDGHQTGDVTEAMSLLSQMERVAFLLRERGIYPEIVRVKMHVENEYGMEYYELVDEDGCPRRIHTSLFLESDRLYAMASITNPACIEPFVTELFW